MPACAAARPSSRPTAPGTQGPEKSKHGGHADHLSSQTINPKPLRALLPVAVAGLKHTSGGVVLLAQVPVHIGVAEALQVPCTHQQAHTPLDEQSRCMNSRQQMFLVPSCWTARCSPHTSVRGWSSAAGWATCEAEAHQHPGVAPGGLLRLVVHDPGAAELGPARRQTQPCTAPPGRWHRAAATAAWSVRTLVHGA